MVLLCSDQQFAKYSRFSYAFDNLYCSITLYKQVEIVPRPERIPEEERNDEELLIDPDSEEEAELDSDDEVF